MAFVAVLAGAKEAVGTDNDPEALMAARANADKNGLSDRVSFSDKDPDELGTRFDIVVANILAFPLIELAPRIMAAIKPKGQLLLSGLLTNQVDDVARAYKKLGLVDEHVTIMNDWAMVSFKKR